MQQKIITTIDDRPISVHVHVYAWRSTITSPCLKIDDRRRRRWWWRKRSPMYLPVARAAGCKDAWLHARSWCRQCKIPPMRACKRCTAARQQKDWWTLTPGVRGPAKTSHQVVMYLANVPIVRYLMYWCLSCIKIGCCRCCHVQKMSWSKKARKESAAKDAQKMAGR